MSALARVPSARSVQRAFEDGGEDQQAAAPILEEAETGSVTPEAKNEFGEIDGSIGSNVLPHAVTDDGQTAKDLWHHAGGTTGGTGNQPTGDAQLTAPVYKSKPATATRPAKAWIKSGTGKVKVVRSFTGVPQGNNGTYKHSPGLVWLTWKAKWRIATHEREHVKKTRELHDAHIKPLQDRIAKYRGVAHKTMTGTDEAAAIAALQTQIDWNQAVNDFAQEDTAENQPMGPVDTADMATADFYHDYGPRKIKGVDYGHFVKTG
jgi:hypothetical protein